MENDRYTVSGGFQYLYPQGGRARLGEDFPAQSLPVLHVWATNASLARTLDRLDPFVITGKQTEEQSAIDAGFETEFDRMTR